ATEPDKPEGRCSGQRDKLVIGPGPDSGGSNQGKAGCVHMREKSGIDAALCVSLPAGPAAEVGCAMAGIAAAVATATNRRNSRCIHIGHLPFMSVARPDPAAAFHILCERRERRECRKSCRLTTADQSVRFGNLLRHVARGDNLPAMAPI